VRRQIFAEPRTHAIAGARAIAFDPRSQRILKPVLAETAQGTVETLLELSPSQQHMDSADDEGRDP
jgi:hypothetical protein